MLDVGLQSRQSDPEASSGLRTRAEKRHQKTPGRRSFSTGHAGFRRPGRAKRGSLGPPAGGDPGFSRLSARVKHLADLHPLTEFHRRQVFCVAEFNTTCCLDSIELRNRNNISSNRALQRLLSATSIWPVLPRLLRASRLLFEFRERVQTRPPPNTAGGKVWPRHPTGRTTRFAFQCRELRRALGKLAQDQETLLQSHQM